jgi:citrate synthase
LSSSGTDIYSVISSAIGSLKGSKHGGANLKVHNMIMDIKENVENYNDKNELKAYLRKILNKEAFDKKGLIYGMGHAVYTKSDPRAVLLKNKARDLAKSKNVESELKLYENIEDITKELFCEIKGENVVISANVDLYSSFVYRMLNLPFELFTPIFAIARMAGWCAHRIEQILSDNKIIRPAYKNITTKKSYIPMDERE